MSGATSEVGILARRRIEAEIVKPIRETIMEGAPRCDFRYRVKKPAGWD